MRFSLILILNVAIFVAVRYLSLLCAFLFGMGAADHYKYESYAYLPGTILHLVILFFLWRKKGYQFLLVILVLCFLSVAGFMNIIPYRIIPY